MNDKSPVMDQVIFDRPAVTYRTALARTVAGDGDFDLRRRFSRVDAARSDDSQQLSNRPPGAADRLGSGRVGQGIYHSRHRQSDDQHVFVGNHPPGDRAVDRFVFRVADRAHRSADERHFGVFLLAVVFPAGFAGNHGLDSVARPEVRPTQSGADRYRCLEPTDIQYLFLLGHRLGASWRLGKRQSDAVSSGLSQFGRCTRRSLAHFRRQRCADVFSYRPASDDAGDFGHDHIGYYPFSRGF